MVIFLYGKNTYRSKDRLIFLKDSFIKKYGQNNNLNISILEANNIRPQEINKYFFSRGLFANKKLIIIKSIFNPYNKKTKDIDNLCKEILKPIKDIAKKPPEESNIIIIWDREVKQTDLSQNQKKLFKFLKTLENSTQYKPLSDNQIRAWIKKTAQKRSKNISPKAISLLTDIYDNDLHALNNEIIKISN